MSARPQVVADGVDPRAVFKVRSSTRLNVGPRGLVLLGDTADWTYFVVPLDATASKLNAEVDQYQAGLGPKVLGEFFGSITAIEPYGPSDRRGNGLPYGAFDGEIVVDALLWPSPSGDEALGRLANVEAALAGGRGAVLTSDRRPRTTMARVRVGNEGLDRLLDLMVVERVRAPIAPYLEPSDWLTATADDLSAPAAIDAVIGVIDDGVAGDHPLLRDLIVSNVEIPADHEWPVPSTHGSMVAGLAAYGDVETALRDHTAMPAPAKLAIARVLEPDDSFPGRQTTRFASDLPEHLVIERAIRAVHNAGARVINLSITDPHAYSGPHASIWTETLDTLARELDVVLVVAAGNRAIAPSGEIAPGVHLHADYPTYALDSDARIAEPAIAANVVTVGSLARSAASAHPGGRSDPQDRVIAGVDELSPFSRTGPGLNGTHQLGAVKPEFVHYGGNLVWSQMNRVADRDHGASIVSTALSETGRLFAVASGTSFAAPRVARSAAEVVARYPAATANMIRALLAVSSRVPPAAAKQFDAGEAHRAFGYGMPNQQRALESARNRVVLIYEGEIDASTATIHPIPIPAAFAAGQADRTISVALAYDPPVRRQRREYLAGHLSIDLYRAVTIDEVEAIVRRQPRTGDKVELPSDRRRVADKLVPGAQTVGGSTLQLRRWQAPGARSLDPDDSDTYHLVINHIREGWAERLAEPYERQKYALVVELEDRTRTTVDLYATIEAQLRVEAQARLRIGGS